MGKRKRGEKGKIVWYGRERRSTFNFIAVMKGNKTRAVLNISAPHAIKRGTILIFRSALPAAHIAHDATSILVAIFVRHCADTVAPVVPRADRDVTVWHCHSAFAFQLPIAEMSWRQIVRESASGKGACAGETYRGMHGQDIADKT